MKLHLHPTLENLKGYADSRHWRLGVLMGAVALLTSMVSQNAQALALGRISVQSALGEVLRAEIDIIEINASEAATLKATIASPEAFRTAGIEFMPVLNGVQISIQRRADGRSFLRLTGSRPITEPFVDLILEANWSSGRVARDYTMLFDPPGLRSNSAAAQPLPTAPMIARPAAVAQPARSVDNPPPSPAAVSTPRPTAEPVRPVVVTKPPAAARAPVANSEASVARVAVQSGDTAGKIASQTKASNISLDQMLVALLRGNPEAFIGGNVNRIRSGSLLAIPTPQAAAAVSTTEAAQTIAAQSVDFNAFRRKLAAGVPTTTLAAADRQASGKVQAKVEDRAPANAIPDKLTLSKGAVAGKPGAATDEKIMAERQAQESSTRVAELSKNISDLNRLGVASATEGAAIAKTTPAITLSTPSGIGVPVASAAVAPSQQPAVPASASAAVAPANAVVVPATKIAADPAADQTAAPDAAASAAVTVASGVLSATAAGSSPSAASTLVKPIASLPASELGFTDELLDNPLLPPGIALLVALLGGLAYYRYRQRREPMQADSSFLESRLQPDSFFGASGGQRVDTNEGGVSGSSLAYSPSQLDAAGDVDPVAEADVYLAYGRDLQAEEILKEAMRTSPTRVAILAKLMEIYAKRRDTKAFAMMATDAFKLTRGDGPEWAHIAEMGRDVDPGNPMYQTGGPPQPDKSLAHGTDKALPAVVNSSSFGSSTLTQAIEPQFSEPSGLVDFDLDLDFSMDEPMPLKPVPVPVTPVEALPEPVKATTPKPLFDELIMDFGDSAASFISPAPTSSQTSASATPASFESISITDEDFSAYLPSSTAPTPTVTHDSSLIEFDMSDLALDLEVPVSESTQHSGRVPLEAPLETKFSLAEEFRSLGDPDGARALAEEVLLEATGPLKVKTQAFLNALS